MHSFNGESCNIHYNGDYSGEVIINDGAEKEIRIEMYDLLSFFRQYIIDKKIGQIENASLDELIKI